MIKKGLKQLLFAILIALMLLARANSVFAISAADKGTINVQKVEAGLKVTAYKIATVNYDYTDGREGPIEPPYEWVPDIKNFIENSDDYSSYVDPETFQRDTKDDSGKVADFYDALAAAIRGEELTMDGCSQVVDLDSASGAGVPDGSVDISDLEMGTYLILIENGYKVYKPSVVNLVPEYKEGKWSMTTPATVQIKSSNMSVSKSVKDDKVSTTDTIEYTIVADVPQYPTNALAKKYYISDKFSEGLIFNDNSIKLYGSTDGSTEDDSWTEITGDDIYTKTAERPDGKGNSTFTLDFDYSKIKDYAKIKVTYTAKLKTEDVTVIAESGNKNTAYLDYSNNPYDPESYQNIEDNKNVFTYKATINKIDKFTRDKLSGAKFTLSSDTAGETKLKFVKKSDGVYYVSETGDEEIVVGAEETTKGILEIKGLGDGKYYLHEAEAPEGYNKLKDNVLIEITDNNVNIDVQNDKGFILPITGGKGTLLFTVLGSVLFGIGILLAIVACRKTKTSK